MVEIFHKRPKRLLISQVLPTVPCLLKVKFWELSFDRGSGAGWAGWAFAHPVFRKDHTYSLVRNMKSLVLPTQFSAASGFAHPVFSSFRSHCNVNICLLTYIQMISTSASGIWNLTSGIIWSSN